MLHLVRRFFGFLAAEPLRPSEQAFVAVHLSDRLVRLFYTQRVEDQRHAYIVASRVGSESDVVEAALLHDIGKTAMSLGAVGRSLATLWTATSLPIWGEWRTYRQHGPIGAALLADHGASDLAVSFARLHPGEAPPSCDPADWLVLELADRA